MAHTSHSMSDGMDMTSHSDHSMDMTSHSDHSMGMDMGEDTMDQFCTGDGRVMLPGFQVSDCRSFEFPLVSALIMVLMKYVWCFCASALLRVLILSRGRTAGWTLMPPECRVQHPRDKKSHRCCHALSLSRLGATADPTLPLR